MTGKIYKFSPVALLSEANRLCSYQVIYKDMGCTRDPEELQSVVR